MSNVSNNCKKGISTVKRSVELYNAREQQEPRLLTNINTRGGYRQPTDTTAI
ncbi:unnamed protein product [Fusarium graminearum]|uniref:Chromosome 3, complete genome n=1 Tax=Gibberella zeae (strain ATCC MYA-4620 / CBS 123657 / FGSC 9075 / NRRL 31084 / PH-1) TaxID=229533 RepID=A0A098E303_GIBZE|nr:unnamed protein product [Fusarium graminearum]CZS83644.1 unnamed protein product [Fusarium graminearum]